VQDGQSRLMRTSIWAWPRSSSLAGLGDLFDTLAVFENYPVDRGSLAPRPAACGSPTSAAWM